MHRVSIITPTFNSIEWIDECVEHVAAQGISGLEHIVVDGGSTDGTAQRLADLAKVHKHLRFVSEPDQGQSDALNKATLIASAPVISSLNADDYYEQGAIEQALDFLDKHPRIDFVTGDCRAVNKDGSVRWINRPKDLRLESLLLGWAMTQFPLNPSAYFYRRKVHDIVGGYDPEDHYSMDVKFLFACAERTRMAYVPRIWGNFRLYPGAKTYDDRPQGNARRAAAAAPFIARLSPRQKAYMALIRVQKKLYFKAAWHVRKIQASRKATPAAC